MNESDDGRGSGEGKDTKTQRVKGQGRHLGERLLLGEAGTFPFPISLPHLRASTQDSEQDADSTGGWQQSLSRPPKTAGYTHTHAHVQALSSIWFPKLQVNQHLDRGNKYLNITSKLRVSS